MDRLIRVLHVVTNMNNGPAETFIMNIYRNIDRTKIQFDFLTCKLGAFDEEIENLGGRIYRIPTISSSGYGNYLRNLEQFFQMNKDYEIVHSHVGKVSGFVLMAAEKAGIKGRIVHSHAAKSKGSIASKLYQLYAGNYIEKSATHYIASSTDTAKWLFKNKLDGTVILKNGIETDKFKYCPLKRAEIREEVHIGKDSAVIGHIGRFNNRQNHSFLIDLFNEYSKLVPDCVLVFVGDGSLRLKVEEQFKNLNLEHKVRFLGIRPDIDLLLQACDLLVSPSIYESLPVTLIEAQAAGLPCLISDGITDEADIGLNLIKKAPANNKRVWLERMSEIVVKEKDRNVCTSAFSKRGHDVKEIAQQIESFYFTVLENSFESKQLINV
ncbi:glycosyltransferase [Metabacillus fastidiosus]|uniref:glycosyltransferase n=1 Tax=Metabacillus fastidiosus TaxID=1458 RepID=UPI000B098322|nr:glycosyltransferase [Metabacillus fastidiosus]MED4463836.1 glycosyltransferase [Metabacillus fastidiosus]